MKTLYLVRHAKAVEHSALHDFERMLTEIGERDAQQMGKKLYERRVSLDLILASPAFRTLVTAQTMSRSIGLSAQNIATDKRIYEASDTTLLKVLNGIADINQSVMLVGHNPGFTEFANNIFSTMISSMATAGVIGGTLSIDSWQEAKFGAGRMEFYFYP